MPIIKFLALTNDRIRAIIIWGTITGVFSTVVYFGANEIASKNTHFYQLYFEFERSIPMVPWMIYIYQSFALLITINYFSIKSPQKIKIYSISFMSSCAIAAVFLSFFLPSSDSLGLKILKDMNLCTIQFTRLIDRTI